jgi:phosphoribosylformylglycinamidine cyclo-ligase
VTAPDDTDSGERAYRAAGVDVVAGRAAVDRIREVAAAAARPELLEGVGGFAGLFDLGDGRVLAAATDGVGTKLEVAREAGRLDTVGIDLVAMSANDVVCTGAEPLFFLDYLAMARVDPDEAASIVAGVAEGCRRAGCALLGGETAEHPGTMEHGRFDLAGFCVGVVRREELLGPHRVRAGDALIGLPSTGLHSNGYSLVRSTVLDRYGPEDAPPPLDRPLIDELLEPTAMYVRPLLALARGGLARAAAHVTGGGFHENVPRALPAGTGAVVDPSAWRRPPIFDLVAAAADLEPAAMYGVLNMGIGMVVVVPPDEADRALSMLAEEGTPAVRIGTVTEEPGLTFV